MAEILSLLQSTNLSDFVALALVIYVVIKGFRTLGAESRQVNGDVTQKFASASASVAGYSERLIQRVTALEERVETLKEEVERQERIIESYRKGIDSLIDQLRALGVDPAWSPD